MITALHQSVHVDENLSIYPRVQELGLSTLNLSLRAHKIASIQKMNATDHLLSNYS